MGSTVEKTMNSIATFEEADALFTRIYADGAGLAHHRHTLTVLNILVGSPRARKLLARHISDEREKDWSGLPNFPNEDSYEDSYEFWSSLVNRWDIGYMGGHSLMFVQALATFTHFEACAFIEEQYRPYRAVNAAVAHGDALALKILGGAGWAKMPEAIQAATTYALIHKPGPSGISMLQTALCLGVSKPSMCRQIYMFAGGSRIPGVLENPLYEELHDMTVFELCSLQSPNSENTATVLRMLLEALKQGNENYPAYGVHYIRGGFSVALKNAVEATAGIPVRLRVLETYLELCERDLVQKSHAGQWKIALGLKNAAMLREMLCMEISAGGGILRTVGSVWRLKVSLPEVSMPT